MQIKKLELDFQFACNRGIALKMQILKWVYFAFNGINFLNVRTNFSCSTFHLIGNELKVVLLSRYMVFLWVEVEQSISESSKN